MEMGTGPGGVPPQGPGQGYVGQPGTQQYGGGQGGPGMAAEAAQFSRRHIRTSETKEFFKTSEFAVWLLITVAILIAGLVISGGDDDEFRASTVWTLVTVLSVGYMLSRGLSKTGARRGRGDDDR